MSKRRGPPKVSGLVQSGTLGSVDQSVLDRMPSFGDDDNTFFTADAVTPSSGDTHPGPKTMKDTALHTAPVLQDVGGFQVTGSQEPGATRGTGRAPVVDVDQSAARIVSQADQTSPNSASTFPMGASPSPSARDTKEPSDRVIVRIRLDLIDESPYQNRANRDENYVADLSENIRADGLNDLPSVRPRPGGRFELLTGSNRTAAVRLLGWTEVDAEIRDVDDNKAARLVFFDNFFHKPLQDYEIFKGFANLMALGESSGAAPSQRSLAKEAGISPAQMTRLFSFAKLPVRSREILNSHPSILQANAAESLVRFCEPANEHLVIDAIEQLRDKKLTQGRAASWIEHRLSARPTKSERTLTSRDGKQFAKLERMGQRVTVKIAAGIDSAAIENAMFQALRQHADQDKLS